MSAIRPSSISAESSIPRLSFRHLPAEIREQIWLDTLAPRLILIHPHERFAAKDDEPREPTSIRFNHTVHASSATPGARFKAYAAINNGNQTTANRPLEKADAEKENGKNTGALQYKSSAAPAALCVCRESRAIALNDGYVMAFKGKLFESEDQETHLDSETAFWQRNHLAERGIWINFNRDLIMLDVEYRRGTRTKATEANCLKLLAQHFPSDLAQIQRLALGGTLENILRVMTVDNRWAPGLNVKFSIEQEIPKLRELWIDDEVEAEGDMGTYYFERDDFPLYMFNRFPEAEYALYAVNSFLRTKYQSGVTSDDYKPMVQIVRGQDWHGKLVEGGL